MKLHKGERERERGEREKKSGRIKKNKKENNSGRIIFFAVNSQLHACTHSLSKERGVCVKNIFET